MANPINSIDANTTVSQVNENAGLSRAGQDAIDTGRYLLQFGEGGVTIYDKQSGNVEKKSFQDFVDIWGDPHMNTADGNYGAFQKDNFTLELQDGTKVTVQVGELRSNGTAVVKEIGVTKGNQGVLVTGFNDGKAGLTFENGSAVAIDGMHEDGIVMTAHNSLDELYFSDGTTFIGGTTRSREELLDGKGGQSAYAFDEHGNRVYNGYGSSDSGFQDTFNSVARRRDNLEAEWQKLQGIGVGGKLDDGTEVTAEMIQQAQMDYQRAQDSYDLVVGMWSKMIAKEGDLAMQILNNF